MIQVQNIKHNMSLAPISVNAASATCTEVDARGWHYAQMVFFLGAIAGGDMSAVKLQAASASGGSFADITGATLGTMPTATDDGKFYIINVDLRKSGVNANRFLKPVITVGAGGTALIACDIILSRGDKFPSPNTTDSGAAEVVNVG